MFKDQEQARRRVMLIGLLTTGRPNDESEPGDVRMELEVIEEE
jgi:hypothetical protein